MQLEKIYKQYEPVITEVIRKCETEIIKIYKQCEPEIIKIIKQCETVIRPLVALLAISYLIYQIHVLPLYFFLSISILTLHIFSNINDKKGQDGLFYAVWTMTISVFILAFLPVPELLMSIVGIADAVFTIRYSAFKIIQLLPRYNGETLGESSNEHHKKNKESANTPIQSPKLKSDLDPTDTTEIKLVNVYRQTILTNPTSKT